MANAKKCDRCGRFYEERPRNTIEGFGEALAAFVNADKIKPNLLNDLCCECEKSLNEWWKEGADNEQRDVQL